MTKAQKIAALEALATSQGTQSVVGLIDLLADIVADGGVAQILLTAGTGETAGKVTTYPISDSQTDINAVIAAAAADPVNTDIKIKVGSDYIKLSSIAASASALTGKLTIATGSYALSLSTTASSSSLVFTAL